MNAKAIAQLRTESLAATLCAARQRRVRRRAVTVLGSAAAFAAVAIAILPMREVKRAFTSGSGPTAATIAVAPAPAVSNSRIRTNSQAVIRISTVSDISHIRVSTAPALRVERIDRDDLRAWFPENGIAFIQQETGPPGFVVF